jgi:hypothetical protein
VDDFIKQLCVRLAGPTPERSPALAESGAVGEATVHSSRRGFLGTMGKMAAGAAAVVAGTAFFTRPAEAASLHCCEGRACAFKGCAAGMALGYTWSCAGYFCHDCFTDYGAGHYHCTYTVARGHTSSHHTTAHHTSSSHASTAPSSYGGDGGYGGYSYGPPSDYFGWG